MRSSVREARLPGKLAKFVPWVVILITVPFINSLSTPLEETGGWILPSSAFRVGANGAEFHTDVRILNLGLSEVTVTPTFYDQATSQKFSAGPFVIGARSQKSYDNVLESLFNCTLAQGCYGPIRFQATGTILVSSSVNNVNACRTGARSGQWLPGINALEAIKTGVLGQLAVNWNAATGYRTNVVFMNPGSQNATVQARLRHGEGALLSSATIGPLAANEFSQVALGSGEVFPGVSGTTDTNLWLEFTSDQPVLVFASVINNASGDPFAVVATPDVSVSYRVAAFYFPRYGTPQYDGSYWWPWRFWGNATYFPPEDIMSDYYPTLGPYSSNDAAVIDQHLAWLQQAGVGLIILSWHGRESYEAKAVPLILERASRTPIKVTFLLEAYDGRSVTTLPDDVRYIYQQYGPSPAFFRTNQTSRYSPTTQAKGVFFLYAGYENGSGIEADATYWRPAIDAIHASSDGGIVILEPNFPDWIEPGHFDGVFNFTHLHLKNEFALWARALPPGAWFVPSVVPGFAATRLGYPPSTFYPRQNGAVYDFQWQQALSTGIEPKIVTIASFNEWNEGSQIEPAMSSVTSGRGFQYRDYESLGPAGYLKKTASWKESFLGKAWPPFIDRGVVFATLGSVNHEDGLWQLELGAPDDGGTEATTAGGKECRSFMAHPSGGRYMYFAVQNDFIYQQRTNVEVAVDYYARGNGEVWLDYDSTDPAPEFQGVYKDSQHQVVGPGSWRTVTFALPDALFAHRQKAGADFRIALSSDPAFNLCVNRVTVRKVQ